MYKSFELTLYYVIYFVVDSFISSKKLKTLGMPVYHGSGSHDVKDTKYRFVVMERFGSDIWKIFLDNKKIFNPLAVYKVGIQIVSIIFDIFSYYRINKIVV